jgi:hypothetical protein
VTASAASGYFDLGQSDRNGDQEKAQEALGTPHPVQEAALARVHTHDNLPPHAVRSACSPLAKDIIRDREKEQGCTRYAVDNRYLTALI